MDWSIGTLKIIIEKVAHHAGLLNAGCICACSRLCVIAAPILMILVVGLLEL